MHIFASVLSAGKHSGVTPPGPAALSACAQRKKNGRHRRKNGAARGLGSLCFIYLWPDICAADIGIHAQIAAHRGGNAAEPGNRAKVCAGLHFCPVCKEGHVFARVVCGAGIGGVAAVVGSDDEQVILPKQGKKLRSVSSNEDAAAA